MVRRRSPARFLAPLALIAAIAAVLLVVQSTQDSGSPPKPTTTHSRKSARHRTVPRFYTVRPGDILSTIAQRTGVPIERLQELNPSIDPQALQTGQRLRLRA